jgi:CrcB protein
MLPGFLVFIGGGAGAVARWAVGLAWLRLAGPERPWAATLVINVIGGFLMGLLVGVIAARGEGGDRLRLLLGTGGLGGFTTFSTFSLEAVLMIERRQFGLAAGYVSLSVVLSIAALALGLVLMRRVFA